MIFLRIYDYTMKLNSICSILIIFLSSISPNIVLSFDPSLCSVKLNRYSEKVYNEKVSKYRILSFNSKLSLPDTPFQRVTESGTTDNNYFLQIYSGKISSMASSNVVGYDKSTRLLDYEDPQILKLKSRFQNSKDIIEDVESFVFKYISHKEIGIPIIPASQILKNRSGDCTEHAVLCVAILRSLGIQSRALVGMVLCREFEGSKNVFVFHMWTEAYDNGVWHLVDATRPGKKHYNHYISFSYHHLKTEMPLSYLKAISAMKSFSVEYIEK